MGALFEKNPLNLLKLLQYPPPLGLTKDEDARSQGVGAHKDSLFLTFLLQGSPHQGLEVQNKAGTWIPVPPVPDTLVINIGLIFESLTGGVCTATTHRVDLRKRNYIDNHGNSLGPRLSFAFFQSLGLDLRHEDVSLNVPSHIADLVKDEKVKSDAETFLAKDSEGCLGRTIFTGTLTTHTDIGYWREVVPRLPGESTGETGETIQETYHAFT